MKKYIILLFLIIFFLGCNRDKKIIKLLNSDNINKIIEGTNKAVNSGKKDFVPLLLKNANDPRTSSSLFHYGVSVYKAKIETLSKIFKQDPPSGIIFDHVDSSVIQFYTERYHHLLNVGLNR